MACKSTSNYSEKKFYSKFKKTDLRARSSINFIWTQFNKQELRTPVNVSTGFKQCHQHQCPCSAQLPYLMLTQLPWNNTQSPWACGVAQNAVLQRASTSVAVTDKDEQRLPLFVNSSKHLHDMTATSGEAEGNFPKLSIIIKTTHYNQPW